MMGKFQLILSSAGVTSAVIGFFEMRNAGNHDAMGWAVAAGLWSGLCLFRDLTAKEVTK